MKIRTLIDFAKTRWNNNISYWMNQHTRIHIYYLYSTPNASNTLQFNDETFHGSIVEMVEVVHAEQVSSIDFMGINDQGNK